jgi:hypothetical protein
MDNLKSSKEMYQYKFIMNALKDGWSVSMKNESFEFTKKKTYEPDDKEYEKSGYSTDFIKKYGQMK